MDDTKYEYIDNALFIRDKYSSCSIEWNKRPVAKEQLGAGEWKEGNPYQRILVPAHIDAGDCREPLDRFASNVPKGIFKTIAPFKDYQWMMLKLLTCNPYSAELADSNPILAYCLANNQQFKDIYKDQISWEQANLYSRRKQKLILHWLGFPSSGIIVKLLKKIDGNEMSVGLLRLLRSALRTENPTVKLLSHYQTITPGMLGLLRSSIAPMVTSELLADVADNPEERTYPLTGERLAAIQLMQRYLEGEMTIPTFLSVQSVKEYHERLSVEARALLIRRGIESKAAEERLRKLKIRQDEVLGDPPIKGTKDIVPITTKSQLVFEGKDMRNCVASYAGKVRRGEIYIYKVLEPERATLSIKKRCDGVWDTMELKGKCNTQINIETQATVNAWLRTADGYKAFKINF